MIIWVLIILIMGCLLLFGEDFIIKNNLIRPTGLAITLICIGIGVRMEYFRRKGTKEKLQNRVKELEEKLKELTEEKTEKNS